MLFGCVLLKMANFLSECFPQTQNPTSLNHKACSNIPEHTASNPKTQGLKCWSKPSRSPLSPPWLSLCNWWLSWLRRWSVQEVYTKILWQRDKQKGTEGCRQTGDSGITEKSVLPEWHRSSGILDSSQAQCLSHISGDWVIYCRTMSRCWPSFHSSTLRMSSRGPEAPGALIHSASSGPSRQCITEHWTSCNRSFFLPPVQTITCGSVTVLV